jgi:hypothetical protein
VWDDASSLNGRQVRLVGFIVHGAGDTTYLGRLVMSCCAADVRPVKIRFNQTGHPFHSTFAVSELHRVPVSREPYEF